jgi:hypothetical protein
MSKPVTDMTPEEMDAWASQAYSIYVVTEQEAEAKVIYRLGEFIRELGRRMQEKEDKFKPPY